MPTTISPLEGHIMHATLTPIGMTLKVTATATATMAYTVPRIGGVNSVGYLLTNAGTALGIIGLSNTLAGAIANASDPASGVVVTPSGDLTSPYPIGTSNGKSAKHNTLAMIPLMAGQSITLTADKDTYFAATSSTTTNIYITPVTI